MSAYTTGWLYEMRAARYLKRRGLRILARRFRALGGEIDLIAQESDTVVFVEVKARPNAELGRGVAAVGADKRRRIRRAAAAYLRERGLEERACRFDIIEFSRAGIRHVRQGF